MAIVVFIAYLFLAKDAPESVYKANPKKLSDYGKTIKR